MRFILHRTHQSEPVVSVGQKCRAEQAHHHTLIDLEMGSKCKCQQCWNLEGGLEDGTRESRGAITKNRERRRSGQELLYRPPSQADKNDWLRKGQRHERAIARRVGPR
ncbi:hypothetical protein KP509_30G047600 [Ceratopteris richardii]|uniref:Uncharacterized protein n=1 Tax=Ceratopteris richardii TaxID=49495 RepID=A0A8T2R493_CERRI|nr:hypothetical protein KP509_30G047600 [Ceratopteris richardii]